METTLKMLTPKGQKSQHIKIDNSTEHRDFIVTKLNEKMEEEKSMDFCLDVEQQTLRVNNFRFSKRELGLLKEFLNQQL